MEKNPKLANFLLFLILIGMVALCIFLYKESGRCLKNPCGYCKEQNPKASITIGNLIVDDYKTISTVSYKAKATRVLMASNLTGGMAW